MKGHTVLCGPFFVSRKDAETQIFSRVTAATLREIISEGSTLFWKLDFTD